MDTAENLRLIDEQDEAFNTRNWDRYLGYYADSLVRYGSGVNQPVRGKEALWEIVQVFIKAFPDIFAKKERSFGQGNWVCIEYTVTGTHKGPLPGPSGQELPTTGKVIRLPLCHVYKLQGGKITEDHAYFDSHDLMSQLGLQAQ